MIDEEKLIKDIESRFEKFLPVFRSDIYENIIIDAINEQVEIARDYKDELH